MQAGCDDGVVYAWYDFLRDVVRGIGLCVLACVNGWSALWRVCKCFVPRICLLIWTFVSFTLLLMLMKLEYSQIGFKNSD